MSSQEPIADPSLDARKEQIKRAALRVFAEQGLSGTKMSMIAAEAGISQGLSYRYFKSKEEIFTLLVEEALEAAQAAIDRLPDLPGTPTDRIRAFTANMLDASHKRYFLLLQQAQKSEEAPERVKQLIERYSAQETLNRLAPILVQGQQAGEFCEGDPERLLLLYLSVITGLMLQDANAPEGYWLQEIDRLMKILQN
ncbi:TetR/AcrR family transcriptional regulator [Cohnella nanjingensis]|uniref:TetR/AcrR family transcriptional regulator n=1 Tax=Cohnella nanjingensis TaxID=1387779 RepID=A0A7X0RSU9_9BACL|nr:TetR/AcrR family transcriptional regulator [Cohnella nanjingensis]MBB6671569.1 TetR/AcrR family transcriptional regulator [Cohnella nanjingensis]